MKLPEFHLSCLNGDIKKVKELINNDNINQIIKICQENENDEWIFIELQEITPILCAIQNNHLSIVQYLHQQGADINSYQ